MTEHDRYDRERIEKMLMHYAMVQQTRDGWIRDAYRAKLSITRIHDLSRISRVTITRVLTKSGDLPRKPDDNIPAPPHPGS